MQYLGDRPGALFHTLSSGSAIMNYVILDTNIIVRDFLLRSPDMQALFTGAGRGGNEPYTVAIPQIVIDESVKRYSIDYEKWSKEFLRHGGRLRALGAEVTQTKLPTADESGVWYRSYLVDRLREWSSPILPYPRVDHKTVARAAVERRKPFKESGAGYQDALIWRSIVELLDDIDIGRVFSDVVILITSNVSDFGRGGGGKDSSPSLASDLAKDLKLAGHLPTSVRLVNDLQSFVTSQVLPSLQAYEQLRLSFLEDDAFAARLLGEAYHFVVNELVGESARWMTADANGLALDAEYVHIMFGDDAYFSDAVRLGRDRGRLDIELPVEVIVGADVFYPRTGSMTTSPSGTFLPGEMTSEPVYHEYESRLGVSFVLSLPEYDIEEISIFELPETIESEASMAESRVASVRRPVVRWETE